MQKTIFFVLKVVLISFILYIGLIFIGSEYDYERDYIGLGRKN